MKKQMVVGFMADIKEEKVVLIRKTKPVWQAGRLNGVGGKVEPGESPYQAICREFQEEAGVSVTMWDESVILEGPDWIVHFYVTHWPLEECRTQTDEIIEIVPIRSLYERTDIIYNLKWIVPLSLDKTVLHPIRIMDI